jgi:predicted heme/steroid binding protein
MLTKSFWERVELLLYFTHSGIKPFNGADAGKPIYLVVLGKVFDVSNGQQ